jgi:hypothetical protein
MRERARLKLVGCNQVRDEEDVKLKLSLVDEERG